MNYEILSINKEMIFIEIKKILTDYLNDENLCNDNEGFFPKPKYMTGEWYVGDIYMENDYLSISTRFIGTDTGEKDDYLGLEVCFFYDEKSERWELDGINSEAL